MVSTFDIIASLTANSTSHCHRLLTRTIILSSPESLIKQREAKYNPRSCRIHQKLKHRCRCIFIFSLYPGTPPKIYNSTRTYLVVRSAYGAYLSLRTKIRVCASVCRLTPTPRVPPAAPHVYHVRYCRLRPGPHYVCNLYRRRTSHPSVRHL